MEQDEKRNNTLLLSIIIPVYNTHKYLDTLMWALKRQLTDEVEIIIVDGSDEEYNYFKDYKNTHYYRIKNRTAGTSRNYGLDHSSGKYICFIDSDDKVSDDYISIILNKIITSNSFDYCFYSWRTIGNIRGENIVTDNCGQYEWQIWNRVWNRKFIGDKRFPENMNVAEDEMFIKSLCNGKTYDENCKKENITDILYCYYMGRDDNLCTLYNKGLISKYTE